MKKPVGQEIKRKIDSKIFELQSSLLEEGSVTEALLAECAVYFRPAHLQDIVIERSEAESKCGWPVCGNALVLSRRLSSHSLAFGLSDEEEPYRFCSRACMAKTQALLSAIPSTPPYLREGVLRLVSPQPPSSPLEKEASGGQESSSKKAYKRPRRRDIPPSAKPATRVSGPGVVIGERGEGQTETIEKDCPAPEVTGVASTVSEESGHASSAVEAIGGDDDGDSVDVEERRASDVESLQAELGRVSISERACARSPAGTMPPSSSSSPAGAGINTSFAAQGADEKPSAASAPTPPALTTKEASEGAAAALAVPPRPQDRPSSWEGMRFGRSSGAPSVVSLQASLAAEAAATATTIAAPATIDSYNVRAQVPTVATKSATASTSAGYPRVKQLEGRQGGDVGKFNAPPTEESTARRKSVSFAEGTKDPPPSSITSARRSAPASGVAGKLGNRRGRGRGKGRDIASAGGSQKGTRRSVPAAAKPVVLGRVVERKPDLPTPMEMEALAVGRGKAGAIEGHVPTIEADISFSVLPKGYETGRPDPRVGNVDGGVEEKKSGDGGVAMEGVGMERMESLLDEEVAEEPLEEGVEDHGARSLEEAQGVAEDDEGDDDNDRAIWREAFGSEMPPEVAKGPLIDMDTIHDKELREEFASSIGAFALLWSALSEWVTPDTRAVCRAGRAAAAANGAASTAIASAVRAAGQAPSVESPSTGATATTSPWSSETLRARQASAVAAATEAEASRRVKGGFVGGAEAISSANASETAGPTVTGALRHSGLSAMVNMHLGQAERLLLRASPAAGAERPQKWTWSKEVDKARRCGRRRAEGGWLEEMEKQGPGDGGSLEEPSEAEAQANGRRPPPPPPRETSAPRRVTVGDWTGKGGERDSLAAPEPGCSAECRRALSAVIDTMDAGRASAAVNLSIAQWKVLPLVMLTAIGLGGGGGLRYGRDEALVAREEAERGADACARLGGAEAMISAREFEMLVEVFREE